MAEPYVGEIRIFAGNFAPVGWMFCEGQLLPLAQFEALFQLIGTTYGGDGQASFALPDLRGRLPLHQGNGFILAETGGAEAITLAAQQIPAHSHPMLGSANFATGNEPANAVVASGTGTTVLPYGSDLPLISLHQSSVAPVGGSQPHTNMQPYRCVNFIISLYGIFPLPT